MKNSDAPWDSDKKKRLEENLNASTIGVFLRKSPQPKESARRNSLAMTQIPLDQKNGELEVMGSLYSKFRLKVSR